MRTRSYSDFWQQIHNSAKEKSFPLRVMFELTYRCNFRCKHCYVPESYKKKFRQELSTKEIFYILNQLVDIGCFYLGFTGGEPFLRQDIFEILWYAKRKGFQIIIYTNGSLINKAKAEELKRLNPNKVDITIPAMSEGAFECISGVTGSRDKVFKAIKLLYKRGVKLGFKTCLLKGNESQMKDIQDFAVSLGASHRLSAGLSRRLDGSEEPYQYRGGLRKEPVSRSRYHVSRNMSNTLEQKCDLEECNTNTVPRSPFPVPLFKCGVGINQVAINPFGELKMCLMINYPKYKISNDREQRTENREQRRQNLKEAWDKLKELVASITPDRNYQCDKCQLYNYCKWCPARGWLYNRSFTGCDPQSRHWAQLRKQDTKI